MSYYHVINIFAVYVFHSLLVISECDVYTIETGKPCTYFGADRVSSPESSLINCSWYASNACCKRTEVTSVFGEMYPLYGATKECSNRMNYLMCYFCSPEQYIWYNRKAYICEDYCNTVYEHCWSAEYNGTSIGDKYLSGTEFCLGQRFEVVKGTSNCFNFDPTVFSHTYQKKSLPILTWLAFVFAEAATFVYQPLTV